MLASGETTSVSIRLRNEGLSIYRKKRRLLVDVRAQPFMWDATLATEGRGYTFSCVYEGDRYFITVGKYDILTLQ